MMKPGKSMLITDIQLLAAKVNKLNEDLSDAEKYVLSRELALIVEKIRIKYGLVSGFYFPAEVNAKEKCRELYGEDLT